MSICLKNATYIDWQSLEFKKTHIIVPPQNGKDLEFTDTIPDSKGLGKDDIVLDCTDKLVTKSFGCGHHHIYSALARGMPAPQKTPQNFLEILHYIWWNLDKNLDLEMIKASALVSALYSVKNGVTFIIDHHASPNAVLGSLNIIKEAFEKVGISHLLCYEISDRDGNRSKEDALAETDDFLSNGNQGLVGLHASFTVGNELLKNAVNLAVKHKTGIHVHVAEDQADQDDCIKTYNKRVINRFFDAGVLEMPKTILGHCLHLNESEISILKKSPAWVAQNVESNLNNNVGLTNYSKYGARILLGTDGMHSNMLRSAIAAFFIGQGTEGVDFSTMYQRFRNIHDYLNQNNFNGDDNRNLVILDYDAPTEVNTNNFLGHFFFGFESRHVDSVIANGKLIYKNKKLLTMDENEILLFSQEMGNKLWRKLKA